MVEKQKNIQFKCDSILHLSKSLRSITQVKAHVGKDIEQGEDFSIACESVNLCSHYVIQYGSSSENRINLLQDKGVPLLVKEHLLNYLCCFS